jgi:hypothetical protein
MVDGFSSEWVDGLHRNLHGVVLSPSLKASCIPLELTSAQYPTGYSGWKALIFA